MKKINVGVIGLGVGAHHVQGYLSHPDVATCGVTDLDLSKVRQVCERYPGRVRPADSADDILKDPEISIVSVASYDNYHAAQVVGALQNGKHVFVEKPMCLTWDEVRQIRSALAKAPSCRLSANMVLRTCPRFIELKNALEQGELGKVYTMRADYLWGRLEKLTAGWRRDTPFYSIILGAAVHMVDLVCWALGRFPVEVRAVGNQIATQDSGLKANDFAALLLTFEDGLVAQVSAHGGCAHPHFHQVEAWGTKKTFFHTLQGGLWVTGNDEFCGRQEVSGDYPAKPQRLEVVRSFVEHSLGRVPRPLVSGEEVFSVMSVCLAAEEAMSTRQPVRIEYC